MHFRFLYISITLSSWHKDFNWQTYTSVYYQVVRFSCLFHDLNFIWSAYRRLIYINFKAFSKLFRPSLMSKLDGCKLHLSPNPFYSTLMSFIFIVPSSTSSLCCYKTVVWLTTDKFEPIHPSLFRYLHLKHMQHFLPVPKKYQFLCKLKSFKYFLMLPSYKLTLVSLGIWF